MAVVITNLRPFPKLKLVLLSTLLCVSFNVMAASLLGVLEGDMLERGANLNNARIEYPQKYGISTNEKGSFQPGSVEEKFYYTLASLLINDSRFKVDFRKLETTSDVYCCRSTCCCPRFWPPSFCCNRVGAPYVTAIVASAGVFIASTFVAIYDTRNDLGKGFAIVGALIGSIGTIANATAKLISDRAERDFEPSNPERAGIEAYKTSFYVTDLLQQINLINANCKAADYVGPINCILNQYWTKNQDSPAWVLRDKREKFIALIRGIGPGLLVDAPRIVPSSPAASGPNGAAPLVVDDVVAQPTSGAGDGSGDASASPSNGSHVALVVRSAEDSSAADGPDSVNASLSDAVIIRSAVNSDGKFDGGEISGPPANV